MLSRCAVPPVRFRRDEAGSSRHGFDKVAAINQPPCRFFQAHSRTLGLYAPPHFVYDTSMDVEGQVDGGAAGIAAAIGEPARARMLYCLVDNHARTSTELAVVGDVSPST